MYFLIEKLQPGVGLGILALHGWQREGKMTVMFTSKPSRCLENLRGEEVALH